jgi:protein gp37
MGATSIEWLRTYAADGSWTKGWSANPIRARDRETGDIGHYCELAGPGCGRCYSSRFQPRFGLPMFAGEKQREERLAKLELWLDEAVLAKIVRRKKATRIFWEDMSDLFGAWVPIQWIARCVAVMLQTPQHQHITLTKHPDRMRALLLSHDFETAVIAKCATGGPAQLDQRMLVGATICNQAEADQWQPEMYQLAAAGWQTWVSYEPALGPVNWTGWEFLRGIVSGGESGPKARPSHPDWHRGTRDFCAIQGIAYHFKQWGAWAPADARYPAGTDSEGLVRYHDRVVRFVDRGGVRMVQLGKQAAGRLLDGREHNEFPAVEVQHA